jgi:hypothetical protein
MGDANGQFRTVDRNVSEQTRDFAARVQARIHNHGADAAGHSRSRAAVDNRREERRLARGKTYKPPPVVERSNGLEA